MGECPLPRWKSKSCQVLWEFICSDISKNPWLCEARAGFSSKRSSHREEESWGVSPPKFLIGCVVPWTFLFLKKLNFKADALTVLRTWDWMVLLDLGVQALVRRGHQVLQTFFYCTSRVLYRCLGYVSLSFQILCVRRLWKTQLVYKGEGFSTFKTRIYLGPGDLAVGNLAICTDF